MSVPFSPTRCHIDLGALRRNYRRLSRGADLMPVIKADAYGHGLLPVAGALAEAGAARFAVGGAFEGVELRKAGHGAQILLLTGCQTSGERDLARQYQLLPAVGDFASLERYEAMSGEFSIALKHDSGMGRLGFSLDEIPALLERLRAAPHLRPVFAFSHLASADMPEDSLYVERQIRSFGEFCRAVREICPDLECSLGNSAALLAHPRAACDVLRPGLAIYGGNPLAGVVSPAAGELEWAMSISTPILQVKKLQKGQSVSYGRIFTAPCDMLTAIVACGYAQGLSRGLSGRCDMLVRGVRLPQVGRICMSMSILDASKIPQVQPGEPAFPLGGKAMPGEKCVDAAELAKKMDTIPYEVLCAMGSLNHRTYSG